MLVLQFWNAVTSFRVENTVLHFWAHISDGLLDLVQPAPV